MVKVLRKRPMAMDGVARSGEPFDVPAEFLQHGRGKMLHPTRRRAAKWFEQARVDKDGDVVKLEA